MPGVGPVTALAIETFAPDLTTFKRGRDFATSCDTHAFGMTLGLEPKQHSTGGKARLGKTSNPLGTMLRMTLTGNGWDSVTSAPVAA
nr:transposase [Puniceibacterium antarcticum]